MNVRNKWIIEVERVKKRRGLHIGFISCDDDKKQYRGRYKASKIYIGGGEYFFCESQFFWVFYEHSLF